MPNKSKRKKFKYSSSGNPNKVAQKPTVTTVTSSPVVSRPSAPPMKSSPSSPRAAAAQYAPDQFKYVGTELRFAGILSAIILIIIVALYFVLR